MATYKLKRKIFGIPTFGLGNITRAVTGIGKNGEALGAGKQVWEATKGIGKLGATAGAGFMAYQGMNSLGGTTGDNSRY